MTDASDSPAWRGVLSTRLRDLLRRRVNARPDWRQIIASAALPPEIADSIYQTVGGTRLWRAEKVQVALELISHFQEGLAADRSVQQLLASFGDPQVAARLIGRAKKRCRPVGWQVAKYSGLMLAALVIAYLAAGVYLLLGRPTISINYLAQINERALAVPVASRAWPLYRDATIALQEKPNLADPDDSTFSFLQNVQPGDAEWPRVERFLLENAGAMVTLRQAGRLESLGLPLWPNLDSYAADDRELFLTLNGPTESARQRSVADPKDLPLLGMRPPYLQLLTHAAAALVADCSRAALAGEGETAMADIQAQLAICRHLQESPFLASARAADTVRHGAFRSTQEMLSKHAELWSNDDLRTLAHTIARTEIDWRRALDGERAAFYDMLQRIYTDDGHGDGRIAPNALHVLNEYAQSQAGRGISGWWTMAGTNVGWLPAANALFATRREAKQLYDRFSDLTLRTLDSPYWEWRRSKHNDPDRLVWEYQSTTRYGIVTTFSPRGSRTPRVAEHRRGMRDGSLVGIALEMYRRELGEWPQSLNLLAPRWLPTVPVDRITGAPLLYRIADGDAVVYSVGVDLDDDGSRPPTGAEPHPRAWRYGEPAGRSSAQPEKDPEYDGDWVLWSTALMPASDWDANRDVPDRE